MHRRYQRLSAVLLLPLLAGCASLDHAPDVDRAASLLEARIGIRPAWQEGLDPSLTEWDASSPLRHTTALALALANNPEIRADLEQIAAARADLVQAGLLPNPVLGLTLRFPAGGGAETNVGLSVVEQLTALWLRPSRIRTADAELNQTILSVSDRALRVAAEASRTHAGIVFLQRDIELTRQSMEMLSESLSLTRRRIDAGEATALDVNRVLQQQRVLEAELARERRDLERAKRELLLLLGMPGAPTGWAADESGVDTAPEVASLTEEQAVALILPQRLDVAAARAVVAAREAELDAEQRSRLRDFAAGLDFESEGSASSVGPVFDVVVPIFDTNRAQIAKAEALARAAVATERAVYQRAVRDARVAWLDFRVAAELAETYRRDVLALAEENLALTREALTAGQVDTTVLIEAQRAVIDARQELNRLRAESVAGRIGLQYAVGGSLTPPRAPGGPAPEPIPQPTGEPGESRPGPDRPSPSIPPGTLPG